MRLRRLDLTRYGRFTGHVLDFGEAVAGQPDLHVVYGPNEAGKSTAFAAFLDLLFGIEPQSRFNFLHQYPKMQIGGCLELAGGARELLRLKRAPPSLRDAAGEPVAEGLILGDLGGLDRASYRTMFSLDDDTLEAGGESILASNGELGQLLFSATAGLSDLSRTLLAVRQETEKFARPHSRSGALQLLRKEIDDLKQQRDAIDTRATEYHRLAAAAVAARDRHHAATRDSEDARTQHEQMQRLLAALPSLARLDALAQRLAPLAALPAAPPGWLDQLPALEQAEHQHRSETEQAEAEIRRLSDALAALAVDPDALRLVGQLEVLDRLRARHSTAELDLPRRRDEHGRAGAEIGFILRRLGRGGETEPTRLLLDAAQGATLDRLIATRSGIEARVSAARDEHSQALQALTAARQALEGAGAAADAALAPVVAALAALRASDHAMRWRSAARTGARLAATLDGKLAALAPWRGDGAALAALALPDIADVRDWQVAAERAAAQRERRAATLEEIATDVARREAEHDAIGRSEGLLSDAEAAAIRHARETAWAAHRGALDAATADAFEAAMRHDDAVGSRRLGHERALAQLHEMTRGLAMRRAELEEARALLDQATAECERWDACAVHAAAGIGPEPACDPAGKMSLARLLGWLERRAAALDIRDQLDQAGLDAGAAQADAAALTDRLIAALGEAGDPVEPSADAEALAAQAQAVLDRAQRAQALHQDAAACAVAVRRREHALQGAAQADKAWQAAWHAACAACWLGAEAAALPVEAVQAMLDTVKELEPALRDRASLAGRIRDMEQDQAAFGRELEGLCAALGIDPAGQPEAELDQRIVARIAAAQRDDAERARLRAALDAAAERGRQVQAASRAHAQLVGEMKAAMGADTLIALAGKLRDAAEKAGLEREMAAVTQEIRQGLRVASVADARALLAPHDIAGLEQALARLAAERDALGQRTNESYAASAQAADRLAAIGGDDAAARLDEARRTKLLEIEERARHHLRLRAGIAAAERALRVYRDQHRSAMLHRASETFAAISRGAYRGLGTQPDRDGDILVALGADGASKLATDLSKGTRFQLYLALRAAGYTEFARQRRPVPFIADDIMETFDDFRAEEGLRVFAEMAGSGQVIYLTHHDHLRAMAERAIPGVRIHHLAG